ncbi:MAG TPA: hypothetical protein VF865_02270 [Acidobacteriaceae bacterium]
MQNAKVGVNFFPRVCRMCKTLRGILLVLLLGTSFRCAAVYAQNFGGAFQRKRIILIRKLPPTGHIDGSSINVKVTGAGADVTSNLEVTIENLLVNNDSRLRSVAEKDSPDAQIACRITTYALPPPQRVTEATLAFGKKGGPFQNQAMNEYTGQLTITFQAQDLRGHKSIAADTVTSKYDRQFPVPVAQPKPSMTSILTSHIPKVPGTQTGAEDKPPTPEELRDKLIKDMAFQIVSRLVNTSEQVEVDLARGGGLDPVLTLIDQKLWTRALEQLETMPPFAQPEDDAYRLYDLGVVNEALGYQSEDVIKARKYLQEASIDYGKAIDAKPTEKNFMQPQTRIDTALAHYKTMGDRMNALLAANAPAPAVPTPAPVAPPPEALTNADVISMVAAKLDEANIIDTIKQASTVKFDLSAHGQIDLSKGNVNGRIITAMKQKARGQ